MFYVRFYYFPEKWAGEFCHVRDSHLFLVLVSFCLFNQRVSKAQSFKSFLMIAGKLLVLSSHIEINK